MEITLPNNWSPRAQQLALWRAMQDAMDRSAAANFKIQGGRSIEVAHRRWGKDDVALHWTATSMMRRPGNYWHLLPESSQARKAIWTAINPHTGRRRIDEAFPRELRKRTHDGEMVIEFYPPAGSDSGSTWQVGGSDNFDSLVGSAPVGIVFSEWALADPQAWAYLRPILMENGGWAMFIYTPRGRNHGATFYERHKEDDNWYTELSPVTKTRLFSEEALAQELKEYQDEYGEEDGEAKFLQEYHCDFNIAVIGSYYGRLLSRLEENGQITAVPYDPTRPVYTAWDVGATDNTSIWMYQVSGLQIRMIDFLESSGQGLGWYAAELRKRPYSYGRCTWPHDVGAARLGKEVTTLEQTFNSLQFYGDILPNTDVEDGIQAVRNLLPRCWFDRDKCARGLEALRHYHRKWDDKLRVLLPNPVHDWSSHAADGMRYLAKGVRGANEGQDFLKPLQYSEVA